MDSSVVSSKSLVITRVNFLSCKVSSYFLLLISLQNFKDKGSFLGRSPDPKEVGGGPPHQDYQGAPSCTWLWQTLKRSIGEFAFVVGSVSFCQS